MAAARSGSGPGAAARVSPARSSLTSKRQRGPGRVGRWLTRHEAARGEGEESAAGAAVQAARASRAAGGACAPRAASTTRAGRGAAAAGWGGAGKGRTVDRQGVVLRAHGADRVARAVQHGVHAALPHRVDVAGRQAPLLSDDLRGRGGVWATGQAGGRRAGGATAVGCGATSWTAAAWAVRDLVSSACLGHSSRASRSESVDERCVGWIQQLLEGSG